MMYEDIRSLSFQSVASLLGISLERFKHHHSEWTGPCPICRPKKNVTAFNYNDNGRFHCFACEVKGSGAIDLVKLVRGIGFKEAVESLSGYKVPAEIKQPRVEAAVSSGGILKPLAKDSWKKFQVPCPWLEQRIPDVVIRERYGVFCYNNPSRKSAYSNRVMIPVKGFPDGQLYGYLGRALPSSPEPKYLFPRDFPKSQFLFGAHELHHLGIHRIVYLVESPFCVMKFASLGLPAVSCFGWSVSLEQVQLLHYLAKGVIFLPDSNKRQEASSLVPQLAQRLWVRYPPLPEGVQDPEYLSKEQILALH